MVHTRLFSPSLLHPLLPQIFYHNRDDKGSGVIEDPKIGIYTPNDSPGARISP